MMSDDAQWPLAVVQTLKSMSVDANAATRSDGRITLRLASARVDIYRSGTREILLHASLARLPASRTQTEDLVARALSMSSPIAHAPAPVLCMTGQEIALQLAIAPALIPAFAQHLREFIEHVRRRRIGLAAPPAPATAHPLNDGAHLLRRRYARL